MGSLPKRRIRLGTRGSALALEQARLVSEALRAAFPDMKIEIVKIATTGDLTARRNEPMEGGKGDFVKEIEAALIEGRVDAAVHSMKDVPAVLPPGLTLAAFLPREDPVDVLITAKGLRLRDLPPGARVATSSPRRKAMLLRERPDIEIVPIRGNVPTRVRRLEEGHYDGLVLARAGLARLGMLDARMVELGPPGFIPAPCQGIIGVEAREGERAELWRAVDDRASRAAALCERAVVRGLRADCHTPLGVHARIENGALVVRAALLSPDGRDEQRRSLRGPADDPEGLGLRLAREFGGRSSFIPAS